MFTIVIATCDRPDRLRCVLDALKLSMECGGEQYRIVVADNGTRRLSEDTAHGFAARTGVPLRYLRSSPYSKAAALNRGVEAAETEWIAFTDDDTVPDRDWLRAGAACARSGQWRMFGGCIIPGEADQPLPRWLTPGRSKRSPGLGGELVRYVPRADSGPLGATDPVPFGANVFVHRDIYREHGCYDETLWNICGPAALGTEDGEFGIRVRARGETIGYCREARVVHPIHYERCTLGTHFRIVYRYGWRDPIVYFDPQRPRIEGYLLRNVLAMTARGSLQLLLNDPAAALTEFEGAVVSAARIHGRWSAAYRKWKHITASRAGALPGLEISSVVESA